jgi:MFS superfamily sulfate permease-like transporter
MRAIVAVVTVGLMAGAILLVSVAGLQQEAAAVLVGIVAGVAAGVPISCLLLVLQARGWRQEQAKSQAAQAGYPPVIVIEAGSWQVQPAEEGWLLPASQHDGIPARRDR